MIRKAVISISGILAALMVVALVICTRLPRTGEYYRIERDGYTIMLRCFDGRQSIGIEIHNDHQTPSSYSELHGVSYIDESRREPLRSCSILDWLRVRKSWYRRRAVEFPAWLPTILAAVFAAYPTFSFIRGPLRRRRRKRKGQCIRCGYNLMGLPEPRCPECGTSFP